MCPAVSTLISLTNWLSVSSKYDPNITPCPVFQNDCRLIVGFSSVETTRQVENTSEW